MKITKKKQRCLVLGGCGFIGSHLIDALLTRGNLVRVFDRPKVPLQNDREDKLIELVEGDFTSEADIASAIQNCDICFHLISTTLPSSSNTDPIFDIETNLMSTVRLLQNAVSAGVKKIIFISSGGTVYGISKYLPIDENHPTNPISSYGIIKLAIEKYLELYRQLYGLKYVVLRVANPYGDRQLLSANQGAVAIFLDRIIRNKDIEIWGDGSIIRDYIHVSDIISALLLSMSYKGDHRVFNVGSGQGVNLNDLLNCIEQITGGKANKIYKASRAFDVPANVLSIERIKTEFKWAPKISLMDGIECMTTKDKIIKITKK